jgi:hypothetical protein
MAKMSWRNPPPVIVIGGTETFLVGRDVRKGIRVSSRAGSEITRASTEAEIYDALSLSETFGTRTLIVADPQAVSGGLLKEMQESPLKGTCVLVVINGPLNEKKYPFLTDVHEGFRFAHMKPTTAKDQKKLAVRFAMHEASSLLGNKDALSKRFSEAFVNAVGFDIGVVAAEISKMAALARYEESDSITLEHIKALIRPSSDIDMEPLREGLRRRDQKQVAAALDRMRRTTNADLTMLLLRSRGGPADLVLKWLRTAVLLDRGVSAEEIAARMSTPLWIVERDLIPSARRWGAGPLRKLSSSLARADRGVTQGSPSPWVACESALLLGCEAGTPVSL